MGGDENATVYREETFRRDGEGQNDGDRMQGREECERSVTASANKNVHRGPTVAAG